MKQKKANKEEKKTGVEINQSHGIVGSDPNLYTGHGEMSLVLQQLNTVCPQITVTCPLAFWATKAASF